MNFSKIWSKEFKDWRNYLRIDPSLKICFTDVPLVYEKLPRKIKGFAMLPLGAADGSSRWILVSPAVGEEGKGQGHD
jgi:hypothetical protein